MADDGTTRSVHFLTTSVEHPFLATLLAPRLFLLKILDTKLYKTPAGSPPIAVVNIIYQEGQAILTESFCSPILGSVNAAKQSACKLACEYIIKNFMDKLTQHGEDDLGSIEEPDSDQHDDEDDDAVNMEITTERRCSHRGALLYPREILFNS